MSLKISEINNNTNKINFRAEEKKVEKTKPEIKEEEQEESFWERNKSAIIAIGTIAGVAIGIGIAHKFKKINTDENSLVSNKEERKIFENFSDKIRELTRKGENITETVKEFFSGKLGSKKKLQGVETILSRDAKGLTADSWEAVFDGILSIKPTEKTKGGDILSKANKLISKMTEKDLLTPPVVDKILDKIEKRPDITKLNILNSLVQKNYFSLGLEPHQAKFNFEQTKRIMSMLDNVASNEFKYYNILNDSIPVEKVKSEYIENFLEHEKISDNYAKAIKEFLTKVKINDDKKIELVNHIYLRKFALNSGYIDSASINSANELLSVLINTEVKNSSRYADKKIETGYELLRLLQKGDNTHSIIPLEEKLQKAQSLKDLLAFSKPKYDNIGSSEAFNGIREITINLKELHFKLNAPKMSIDEIDRFADDLMKDYDDAINRFAFTNFKYSDDNDINLLKQNFENIKSTIESQLKFHSTESEKVNKIKEKLAKFVKDNNINQKGSNSNHDYGHYERQRSYSSPVRQDAVATAKKTLLDECYNDENLTQYIEYFEGKKPLDKKVVKKIGKFILSKYHPDKVKDETEKLKRQKIFQKFNNAIMTLEKRYS